MVAPATVGDKTGRKTMTLQAPRLAEKRFIHTAELNHLRSFGGMGLEAMSDRIAREELDMKSKIDRTIEYYCSSAISQGVIYDQDGATVLVDFGFAETHKLTLTGDALWTDADSDPINKIRQLKLLIEDDSGAAITGWLAFLGSQVMDALLVHPEIIEMLKTTKGSELAETGRIKMWTKWSWSNTTAAT